MAYKAVSQPKAASRSKAPAAKKRAKGRRKPMPATSNKGGALRGKARAAQAKTFSKGKVTH